MQRVRMGYHPPRGACQMRKARFSPADWHLPAPDLGVSGTQISPFRSLGRGWVRVYSRPGTPGLLLYPRLTDPPPGLRSRKARGDSAVQSGPGAPGREVRVGCTQTRPSVAAIAGWTSSSPLASSSSMRRRVSPMSRSAARAAARSRSRIARWGWAPAVRQVSGRCMPPCVPSVADRRWSPSSPATIGRSTAAAASTRCAPCGPEGPLRIARSAAPVR